MLKKQGKSLIVGIEKTKICCSGLIFDESVGPDPTLESAGTVKPKVTLREDPKQSEVRSSPIVFLWLMGKLS